jgi:hypothetical protein
VKAQSWRLDGGVFASMQPCAENIYLKISAGGLGHPHVPGLNSPRPGSQTRYLPTFATYCLTQHLKDQRLRGASLSGSPRVTWLPQSQSTAIGSTSLIYEPSSPSCRSWGQSFQANIPNEISQTKVPKRRFPKGRFPNSNLQANICRANSPLGFKGCQSD